jgi:hypothetical protein
MKVNTWAHCNLAMENISSKKPLPKRRKEKVEKIKPPFRMEENYNKPKRKG